MAQKYSVNQYLISNILSQVQQGLLTIPEIQRPFVWNSIKVRDLMDSLYQGYPIGYIITWKNPNVRLKDGTQSSGKTILIDGQQRITALKKHCIPESIFNMTIENYHEFLMERRKLMAEKIKKYYKG